MNLQCDIDHPTQTLADLCWLRERFPEGLAGKTHRRVVGVLAELRQAALGAAGARHAADALRRPRDAGPPARATDSWTGASRRPTAHAASSGGSFRTVDSMDEAFEGADVVYPKSWGPYDLMLERVDANRARDTDRDGRRSSSDALARNAPHTDWICDERRMEATKGGDALYMHCLPADIGAEVSPGVMAKHRVNVAREANRKVYVVMALLAAAKVPGLARRAGGVVSETRDDER